MKVALIVAMDLEKGIGKNNDLMWHLPADMKFFKQTTENHIVVMGRKNWDSIPLRFRPLSNRENVVLTRNQNFHADDCLVLHSLNEVWEHYKTEENRTVFIIGGGEIYKQALESDLVTEMYITHVNKKFGADTFFPNFDLQKWKVEVIQHHEKDDKHEVEFQVNKYTRN
jgi:dihydrofolate reductase